MHFLSRLILLFAFLTGLVCFAGVVVMFHPWSTIFVVLYVLGRMARRGGLHLWGHGTAHWCDRSRMQSEGMLKGD